MPTLAREVRRLAFPAIAHSLLQTLVFVVDRAMLGHHAEASLAGMQVAGPIEWSVWSIFSAFTVGTIARVGRHVGARRADLARRAAWASLACAVVFGAVVAALSPLLLAHLGELYSDVSGDAIVAARAYLEVTLAASPLVFVGTAAIAVLQAGGDTRTPLAIGVGVNAIHIAMNRVLILGAWGIAPMGARGAAISTSISFSLVAALAVLLLSRRARPVSLRRGGSACDGSYREEGWAVLRVASPALLERVLYHAGFLGFTFIIARLGDASMAANQALISVEAICFLSADGFGLAAAALVAQKLGASAPAEAERAARISARYAALLLTSLGLGVLALRYVVLPVFSADAEVVAIGAKAAPVLAIAQPFMGVAIVYADALRGGGYTRTVLGVSAASAFLVRLSCTWAFAITLDMGLTGVWIGSTIDWMVRTVLLVIVGRRRARHAVASAGSRAA